MKFVPSVVSPLLYLDGCVRQAVPVARKFVVYVLCLLQILQLDGCGLKLQQCVNGGADDELVTVFV